MSAPCIALLGLTSLSGASAPETITFAPAEGSTVEKVWTTSHLMRAIHMNRSLGEQQSPYTMRTDGIDSEEVLGAIDHYLAVDGGRPTSFRREFHKGRRTSRLFDSGGGATEKTRQKALLRGAGVVFTWVEEEGDYGKYYDGPELEEEYLADLRADLDLLFALPPGPVETGDTWPLAPEALIDLFGRCGTIAYEELTDGDEFLLRALDSGLAGSMEQAFGEFVDGTAQVEFREVLESDAGRLAVLELTCDVRYARNRTDYVKANTIRQEAREGIEYVDAFLKLEVEGTGQILWNLDEQRPAGLAFQGTETAYVRVAHTAPTDPEGIERSQDVTMQGPLTIGATYTVVP